MFKFKTKKQKAIHEAEIKIKRLEEGYESIRQYVNVGFVVEVKKNEEGAVFISLSKNGITVNCNVPWSVKGCVDYAYGEWEKTRNRTLDALIEKESAKLNTPKEEGE